ncbi:hypothetical protein [Streptomyces sp. NPDC127098]|uniref:hypothetical protein n=1 Tax=Streptomyces sp. NPDC127098 TaxID=3347137 RepID=UPI00365AF108
MSTTSFRELHTRAPANAAVGSRLRGITRRRRVPHLLVGVLLVVGCATGGVIAALQMGERVPVLMLAEPVTVGQRLRASDVREVSVAIDAGLEVVSAEAIDEVEGELLAYSLPAGTLLSRQVLGEALLPPTGEAVAAVGLNTGQFPPHLQPGHTVRVVAARDGGLAGTAPPREAWEAVVTAVEYEADARLTVVSLQLPRNRAEDLADWPADAIRLVVVAGE